MRGFITICLLASTVLMTGCFAGTIGTNVKLNDNCTYGVLFDNGTVSLDVKCTD
ncbi:MAG: hypothetical protein HQK96_19585 [Nitrospirae bacterium]|nr:hypothetical protein [Nitrospirota bacterium]